MPIVYQPAAPVGAILDSRSNRNSGGSAGGGGVSLSQMYAEEMNNRQQSAIVNAQLMARDRQGGDQLQEERAQFAARNNFSPRDQGMAQAQMAEQAQRGAIQSQLQQEDFTHSDNVRLQQLQQGKNDILQQHSDGQITTPERDQMLLQLHTGERGISVLNLRKQATEQKYQEQHQKQIAQTMKFQKDGELAMGKLESQAFPDRWAEWADPAIKQSVYETLAQTNPQFAQLNPQQKEALVIEETRRRGGMIMGFQKKPGEWEIHSPKVQGGKAGSGGSGEVPMHESGLTQDDYDKKYKQAHDMTLKEQAWQITNDDGTKKYAHPQTQEWRDQRIQQHLTNLLPKAKGGQVSAATGDGEAGVGPTSLGNLDDASSRIAEAGGISQDEKLAAGMNLKRAKEIFAKYPDPAKMPQEVKDELERARQAVKGIMSKMQAPGMSPEQAAAAAQSVAGKAFGALSSGGGYPNDSQAIGQRQRLK